MMQFKQKGFTLLELLVVITLLAILSVGALVAYDGIGDNAQSAAGANNTAAVDRAIRTYKAVSLKYPNQWDNLNAAGSIAPFDADLVHNKTQLAFGGWEVPATAALGDFRDKLNIAFIEAGIEEIQQVESVVPGAEATPNTVHNEGANNGATATTGAKEVKFNDQTATGFRFVSVLPSVEVTGAAGTAGTACEANGTSISTPYATVNAATGATVWVANDNGLGLRLNKIHDSLETDECQFVIALGFGHDAAHSTASSPAAVATAPTFTSKDINPAKNYGRYFALFHMGTDGNADQNIDATELFSKPRLVAVVDGEGNSIDTNIANASRN